MDSNSVGIIVVKDGKILCGRRHNTSHYGEMCGPGGHVDPGETTKEAAIRETKEEFGITPTELIEIGTLDEYEGTVPTVYLCTKWDGDIHCDDLEIVNPGFKSIVEIDHLICFKPFIDGINLLVEVLNEGA